MLLRCSAIAQIHFAEFYMASVNIGQVHKYFG